MVRISVCGIAYGGFCNDNASGGGAVGGEVCSDNGFRGLGWFLPLICFIRALGGPQSILWP